MKAMAGPLVVLAVLWTGVAEAQSPTVTNVQAHQRPGTLWVDITYDLEAASAAVNVALEVSADDGMKWSAVAKTFAPDSDAGTGVRPGVGKHIAWDAGADVPDRYGVAWRVRLIVTAAGGAAGGTAVTTPGGTIHELVHVPAGPFAMGSEGGRSDERPVHTVNLDGFYIDKYEATNAQYEVFVMTGDGSASRYADDSPFNGPQHPVVGVSWHDAAGVLRLGWTASADGGGVGEGGTGDGRSDVSVGRRD
jgi:formylglycine-generating enzyme required for sulfatase activity